MRSKIKKIKILLSLMMVIIFISEVHAGNRCLDHMKQRITNNSLDYPIVG